MEMSYSEMIASVAAIQEMENPKFKIDDFLNRDKYFKNFPEAKEKYFRKNRKKMEQEQQ